jgi:multiple sugar transport system substrate-binding protein
LVLRYSSNRLVNYRQCGAACPDGDQKKPEEETTMVALNRRQIIRRGGALMGGAALSGLMPLRGAFAQDAARIRFSGYVESQEQLTQTLAVLEAYMAKNPNVTIVPEFTDFGAFTDKIATEAAGGNAPDMFSVNVDLLAEYARRGVITPLNDYVPDPLNLSDYVDGAIRAATIDGNLYAIPNDCIAPAVMYKPTVLEQAGITMPDQMWTWEQLAETAVALTEALGPRFWGLADAGQNYIPCDVFLRSMGKSMFTPDHQFGFEPADLAEWFAYWQKLRDDGGIPPGDVQALEDSGDPATYGIVNGRAAMHISLTDSFSGIQSLISEPLELHMMPNGFAGDGELTQHHYTYAGNSTAVWANSPHRDTIIDIIHFMTFDPEGVEIFYRNSGMIPASQAGRDALAVEGTDTDRKIIDYVSLLQQNPAPPRYPGVTGMSGMLRRANEGVAFGQLTPQQAADQFVAEASERL